PCRVLPHSTHPDLSVIPRSLFVMILAPQIAPLFPYTTLFRSSRKCWSPSLWPTRWPASSGPSWSKAAPTELRPRQRRLTTIARRSEEHTSELQSLTNLVCRLLLEKKKHTQTLPTPSTTPTPTL